MVELPTVIATREEKKRVLEESFLVRDIFHAIDWDDWAFICLCGHNRWGKSTLALWLAYYVYDDWGKALDSLFFTIEEQIHKIKNHVPHLFPTRQGFNTRVGLQIGDDYAAAMNKAITRGEEYFDIYKGAFQTLAQLLGVLVVTMLTPKGITEQLNEKYTHQVKLVSRGIYKYDIIEWAQTFRGRRGMDVYPNPIHVEYGYFSPLPKEVYEEYNERRSALSQDMFQSVVDAYTMEKTPVYSKLLDSNPMDWTILEHFHEHGPSWYKSVQNVFGDAGTDALKRLRARRLLITTRRGKGYNYELSELGLHLLEERKQKEK